MRPWMLLAGCLVLSGVVFFFNLGKPLLWDRDEPRNAGCAREMLERHEWVVPVFNGELRDHKPVLLYWFMMAAYVVLGVNELAARFFSAVFGLGTVLLTFDLGRRWFRAEVGFWAGLMLATCMMFPVSSRAATPDALLIFFATAALWCYAGGLFSQDGDGPPQERPRWVKVPWRKVSAYAAMGLAVLAKGPIGFLLPAAILGLYHMLEDFRPQPDTQPRPWRWVRMGLEFFHPRRILTAARRMGLGWGVLITLAVAAPWYLWVGLRTDGAWLRGFFLTHNVGRFLHPMEDHGGPIFYYPLVLLACFFPWALLLVPALFQAARAVRWEGAASLKMLFLLAWGGTYIGFFSLAGTKLPNYITPALPAFALITAWWLDRWLREAEASRSSLRWTSWVLIGCGAAMAIAIPWAAPIYLPGEESLGLLGAIWIAGGISSLLALRRGQKLGYVGALATAAWVFAVSLFGVAAVRVSAHQQFPFLAQILRNLDGRLGAPPEIAAYDCLEPSWVFYTGRPIRFIPAGQRDELLADLAEGHVCVLMSRNRYQELRKSLPRDAVPLGAVPYFLKKDAEIVLLASPRVVAEMSRRRGPFSPTSQGESVAAGPGEIYRR